MKTLMISLDKKILDAGSLAAERMIKNAGEDFLFILIPNDKKSEIDLDEKVFVASTGGGKFCQFFKLIFLGKEKIKKYQIETITVQDPFFIGLAGWILKFLTGVKLEIQLHGDFYSNDYYKKNSLIDFFRFYLGKFIIKKASSVRVVGERIKKSLIKMGVAENKIIVRPVTIDYEWIKNYQPKNNLHEKYPVYSKIFLFLGRFDRVKNISWLIDIFCSVIEKKKDCLLLLVGGGREEDCIKQKIKKLGLEKNVIVEGWTDDPIGYLKTAACLVFSSSSEGYGLVAMEAKAAGTPVIMTDVGVANYELKFGPEVTIVPVGDKKSFEEAVLKI